MERADMGSQSDAVSDSAVYPSFDSKEKLSAASQWGGPSLISRSNLPTGHIIGQLQYAPATQTTVVTTTTTTTTKFPPLIMPRPPQAIDQKQYPLANTPTPPSLRMIGFKIDGKSTIFTEAEDATMALEQFQHERQKLQTSKGSLKKVKTYEHPGNRRLPTLTSSFTPPAANGSRKRSHDSAAKRDSRNFKGPQVRSSTDKNVVIEFCGQADPQEKSPATPPSTERPGADEGGDEREMELSLGSFFSSSEVASYDQRLVASSQTGHRPLDAASKQIGKLKTNSLATPVSTKPPQQHDWVPEREQPENVVPTPPIQDDDEILFGRPSARVGLSSIPSRLATVENANGQDGSLPSPSLSPVTAAANLRPNVGFFKDADQSSDATVQPDGDVEDFGTYISETPSKKSVAMARQISAPERATIESFRLDHMTFNDIPTMLNFFEAIPDELKGWVMHQLLRRCPKSALQTVADVVNPALKCDFLSMLPLELGLNILKYFDVQSLCRASQVSKKWRHIINGDERAWKELFDKDGFVLPEGELHRAVIEGWGWQDPSGPNGWERDISTTCCDCDVSRPATPQRQSMQRQALEVATGRSRRLKRKAPMTVSDRAKQAKRRDTTQSDANLIDPVSLIDQLSNYEGPYNAANAASLAVPYPQLPLPSLKDLHLFKSLYRRHYMIRGSWMKEEVKPRHIAFQAHDRHVVTCLQFDPDKIITGSDDANINVYDTRTGALRSTLRGHEGGVWALQYEGNILVSGSTDRSVRVWDIENGRQTHVFQGHTSTVRCLQILLPVKVGETADGKDIMMPKRPLIITGSRDSNLRVWKLPQASDPYYYSAGAPMDDTDCPYFVRTLSGHGHSVRAIAAHADTLVSGSYDATIRVWKISTGDVIHKLQGHTSKVYSVVLDHARNRCISGSMDNLVKIWSLETGTCLYTLDGHTSLVGLLDLNSDRLVTAAADSTLRIWDPENGQCKATLSAHTGAITCFQHDGQKVISGSDRTLKLWNVKTGECVRDLLADLTGVWQVKFSDRRCVAAVQRDGMTYIEVLDFGASRDGIPESDRGRRVVVDAYGEELVEAADEIIDLEPLGALG